MEAVLYKFKIRPNKLEEAKKIIDVLKERKKDTLETLVEEGASIESVFFDEEFMYIFKYLEDLQRSNLLRNQSRHKLYEYLTPALREVLLEGEKICLMESATFNVEHASDS